MFFNITAAFQRVTDITPEILRKLGIKGLILDIDRTLAKHNNPKPAKGVTEWLDCMKRNNIKLVILSNNFYSRVKMFADRLGVDYITGAKKPFRKSYQLALMKMRLPKHALAAVGDQIFTDVLGANLFRIKMLYTVPIGETSGFVYRTRKILETVFLHTETGYRKVRAIIYKSDKE